MNKRTSRREILRHCDAVGPEDGVDTRDLIRRATNPNTDRKARQLCRQVERTLSLVLGGDIDDDRLRDVHIVGVEPAPQSNHLLVTWQTAEAVPAEELLEKQQALSSYRGTMRAAIAAAINRRKTPDLSMRVINPLSQTES
jgi:ribosome-binding factor A